jgi:hypothetical protein
MRKYRWQNSSLTRSRSGEGQAIFVQKQLFVCVVCARVRACMPVHVHVRGFIMMKYKRMIANASVAQCGKNVIDWE